METFEEKTARWKQWAKVPEVREALLYRPDLHYGPDLEACAMWVWAHSQGPVRPEEVQANIKASVAQLRRLSRGAAGIYHVGCVKVEVDHGGWATCRIEEAK
jgi:hypothetical protein